VRGLLTLADREWRDVRMVAVVFAVLVLAGAIAIPASVHHSDVPVITGQILLAAEVAIFSGMLAADLVAVDAATRRIEALALLPVPLRRVWTAKVAVLLALTLLFAAWAAACHAAGFALLGAESDATKFAASATEAAWGLAPIAAMTCGVLFVATWLDRSFPAFLLGTVLGGGSVAGVVAYVAISLGKDPSPGAGHMKAVVTAASCVVAAAFLAASRLAFVQGRIHWAPRWRRAAVGFAFLLVVGGTAHAATATWVHVVTSMAPGDPDARVSRIAASPDGRRLALGVYKEGYGAAVSRVWVLDVASGRITDLTPNGTELWYESPVWTKDGAICVQRAEIGSFIDPDTGESRPAPRRETVVQRGWGAVESHSIAGGRIESAIRWFGHDQRWTLTGESWAQPLESMPGNVVYKTDRLHLVRRDLASGEERTLVTATSKLSAMLRCSPDSSRIVVEVDGGWRAIDATDGRVLAETPAGSCLYWSHFGSRFAIAWEATEQSSKFRVIDLDTGRSLDAGTSSRTMWSWPQIDELPDGRLAFLHADGDIDLLDHDLKLVRRLYERRKD
jgi:hypothetical protein